MSRWLKGLLVALLLQLGALSGARCDEADAEAQRLERVNRQLGHRLELARQGGFYLVLDVAARRIDLLLQGVELRSYPVERLEIGRARVGFLPRFGSEDWADRVWSGGRLEPPRAEERVEIEVKPGDAETPEPAVPPEPELRYPTPQRFLVRYADGASLEIVARGPGTGVRSVGLAGTISRRISEVAAALGPRSGRLPRLRLVLAAEDAAAVYRSLPPDTALLVALEPASRD